MIHMFIYVTMPQTCAIKSAQSHSGLRPVGHVTVHRSLQFPGARSGGVDTFRYKGKKNEPNQAKSGKWPAAPTSDKFPKWSCRSDLVRWKFWMVLLPQIHVSWFSSDQALPVCHCPDSVPSIRMRHGTMMKQKMRPWGMCLRSFWEASCVTLCEHPVLLVRL